MLTSAVVELKRETSLNQNTQLFVAEGDDGVSFTMNFELFKTLGRPDILRVRIEDAWNDLDRKWIQ